MDYQDSLDRAMAEKPEAEAGESRFSVPEPNVRAEGSVTVYENFQATVDRLGRGERHVLKFLQNDLGTSAQIDESGRARLTGSFDADRITDVLDAYVDKYVLCPECGLPDTKLTRKDDVETLHCEACGARTTV